MSSASVRVLGRDDGESGMTLGSHSGASTGRAGLPRLSSLLGERLPDAASGAEVQIAPTRELDGAHAEARRAAGTIEHALEQQFIGRSLRLLVEQLKEPWRPCRDTPGVA